MSDLRLTQQQLHDQLLAIRAERGQLRPEDVVDAARDESHPLHHRFEWDDSVAGEAYRRIQASDLIRSVKVTYKETPEGEQRQVRGWSALPAPDNATGYRPTEEVLQDPFASKLLLRQCERDLKALQRKYGHLKEFAELVESTLRPDAA
ncbi:hypothetical protein [Nocardia africana]